MHKDKEHDHHGQDGVQGTRGLAPAEQVNEPWSNGGKRRHLRDAGEEQQRGHPEDHAEVAVALRRAVLGRRGVGVRRRRCRTGLRCAGLRCGRRRVSGKHAPSEVPAIQRPPHVYKTVDQEDPGEGEVIVASPAAVAPRRRLIPRDSPVCQAKDRRISAESRFAPVEFREVEQDVDTAHEQVADGDQVDPVADADVQGVPTDPLHGVIGLGMKFHARNTLSIPHRVH